MKRHVVLLSFVLVVALLNLSRPALARERPFRLHNAGYGLIDSSNPFGPDASAFGSGEITHLGRSVFFGELDLFYRFDSSFDAHGRFEFRASNGDELYATFVGKGSFDGYSFTSFGGTLTIVGGTGRFADASGSAKLTYLTDPLTAVGAFGIEGTIDY